MNGRQASQMRKKIVDENVQRSISKFTPKRTAVTPFIKRQMPCRCSTVLEVASAVESARQVVRSGGGQSRPEVPPSYLRCAASRNRPVSQQSKCSKRASIAAQDVCIL